MTAPDPLTPSQANHALDRLERRAKAARQAQEKADKALADRDDLAAKLADQGVKYADLAKAMDITVDGVTYVLRKVRLRRSQQS